MSSLETLAADCLANVVQYLNGYEFMALLTTGNRLVRHKLSLTCTSLRFEAMPSSKFPFSALNLPNLLSLSVIGIKEAPTYLEFLDEQGLGLSVGSKRLEKLEIDCLNSLALVIPPNSTIPRLPIRERFPSLTTLIIHGFSCESLLEDLFGELPDFLTVLSLESARTMKIPEISLCSLGNLPRNLSFLSIVRFKITSSGEKPVSNFESLLPKNLTYLALDWLYDHEILNYLPSSLQFLRFGFPQGSRLCWKSAPPLIVKVISDLGLNDDSKLPLPLPYEIFECGRKVKPQNAPSMSTDNAYSDVNTIPNIFWRQVTSHSTRNAITTIDSAFNRFPNIEYVAIKDGMSFSSLPSRLKKLGYHYCLQFADFPLPSGLKSVYFFVPAPISNLGNISSSSLRSLHLGSMEGKGLDWVSYELFFASDYQPWTRQDFSQLASRWRLSSLGIDCKYIDTPYSCLEPLKQMETLQSLSIIAIPPEMMESTPEWLIHCVPTNLKELTLHYTPRHDVDKSGIISDDFLRLCNFAETTPRLRTLIVKSGLADPMLLGPFFDSLPRGLLKLVLIFQIADLQLGAIATLPSSLKNLKLELWKRSSCYLCADHFVGLPSRLAELLISLSPQDRIDEAQLLPLLPKSIVSLLFPSPRAGISQRMDGFIRSFLKQNSLCKGFGQYSHDLS